MKTWAAKLFKTKASSHVGLDISTTSIKAVEVAKHRDGVVVQRIGSTEIPEGVMQDGMVADAEKLADVIRTLVATTGIHCKEVTAGLGGRKAYSREISLPVMSEPEMREAIKWDIDQYVPYAPGSYYYDFAVLDTVENEAKILIVAAQQEPVQLISDLCARAGLKLLAVDFEALALQRTLVQEQNMMVVDIGEVVSQLIIYQERSPVLVRTIPFGGRQFTEAVIHHCNVGYPEAEQLKSKGMNLLQEQAMATDDAYGALRRQFVILAEDLSREIRRTYEYYQMQNPRVVMDRIYLSGGGARLVYLPEFLQEQLQLPVVVHDPLLTLQTVPMYDKQYLTAEAARLAIAIGLGLRGLSDD